MLNVESMLEDIKNALPTDEVIDRYNSNQSSNNQVVQTSRPLTPVVSDTKAQLLKYMLTKRNNVLI